MREDELDRCDGRPADVKPPLVKAKKKGRWSLEPHICRECLSRLVSAANAATGLTLYHCVNCGADAEHTDSHELCCCGIKIKRPMRGGLTDWVDAGIRCIPNPNPTPEFPSLYVASEVIR